MDRPRLLLIALLAWFSPHAVLADEAWLTDFNAAQRQAAQSGRLLIVHFWASWCGPCAQMEREVLTASKVKQSLTPNFVLCKLNYDEHSELAKQFQVDLLPSDIVLGPDGKLVGKSRGNVASNTYVTRLTQILEQSKAPLVARAPANPALGAASPSTTTAIPSQLAPAPMSEAAPPAPPMSPPPMSPPPMAPPPMSGAQRTPQSDERLGLEGYCPVQLSDAKRWVEGDSRWSAAYGGQLYRCAGPQERQRFLAEPERYAPRLAGVDGVVAAETGRQVVGRREHGVFWQGHVYLFASEASLARFAQSPARYAGSLAQAQAHAPPSTVR